MILLLCGVGSLKGIEKMVSKGRTGKGRREKKQPK